MKYLLINDRKKLNVLYRSDLIKHLGENNVSSIGIFDKGFLFIWYIFTVTVRNKITISSNLKSNLIVSFFVKNNVFIIVNGLGRWRKYRRLRLLILHILCRNDRTTLIIQNYADFRFIKRFYKRNRVHWVPGSGGEQRTVARLDNFICVSRQNKFKFGVKNLRVLAKAVKVPIYIVGVDKLVADNNFRLIGRVKQADIFKHGNRFVHPSGYGEGVPHVLVDAICSGMTVYMQKDLYVACGFYKLKVDYTSVAANWVQLNYSSELKFRLGKERITSEYVRIINNCF